MSTNYDGYTQPLPGMALDSPDNGQAGYIERALLLQIERQRDAGEIDDRHAGRVALALVSARKADRLRANEKAYGVAQVLAAVKACLELLPDPVAHTVNGFEEIVKALQNGAPLEPAPSTQLQDDDA